MRTRIALFFLISTIAQTVAAADLSRGEINKLVDQLAREHSVDAHLIKAIIRQESSYKVDATSSAGAAGLMQLMPDTAAQYGVDADGRYTAQLNLGAGIEHVAYLTKLYDGDLNLILAAYNAGEGAVARAKGVPLYHETINYILKVYGYYLASMSGESL